MRTLLRGALCPPLNIVALRCGVSLWVVLQAPPDSSGLASWIMYAGDDDAEAKRDSPARKRRISGSGDDFGVKIFRLLYLRVEVREELYSILVALGSGALEPVPGFAEVDFRAFSVPVTHAKASLCQG